MGFLAKLKERFAAVTPLPAGLHHRVIERSGRAPYRVHLRLHPDGSGLLILNAATVLHLNATAAEYAFHFIKGTSPKETARQIAHRYRVSQAQALADYRAFLERIHTLVNSEDLDPVTFLGFERVQPHSEALNAPLRLDCALTYALPAYADQSLAPAQRASREMSTNEWQHVLESAWTFGIPHVTFTGGEPTLRPDLPQLIAFAEQIGQVTGLLTDGLKLADKEYLSMLLRTGLDHLLIILQPENPLCWQAIETVTPEDIFTTVHITLNSKNQGQAAQYIQKLAEKGVNSISLSATSPGLDEALQSARNLVAEAGLPLTWDLPVPYSNVNPVALETAEDHVPPGGGRAWLYVEPDGDVLPAQGFADKILGNLLQDDWQTIWQKATALFPEKIS